MHNHGFCSIPFSYQRLASRFFPDNANDHEMRVMHYSLSIFDAIKEEFSIGPKERRLLYLSAILHDIGYEISAKKHDSHTLSIIRNDPFFNCIPHPERLMLALIAGGHRKKISSEIHLLSKTDQLIVNRLAAILRIADAIDYPRDRELRITHIQLHSYFLEIHFSTTVFDAVRTRIEKKSSLFEKTFDRPLKLSESV
ncbi:exopolyphosphatase / guanosine-5'-triphosphate,3'-diphosphate pyrophosphatase [Tindallia magadiensis]|uniref:Exopolyphosphatase / guanosine-5'-triphosphate,3'-diphosphate pyrophosphatase n=1 Tax=Tindallia magadiensis TaxID=69895 RepID=A0A1I3BCZ9_9FIRM|nr:HD domain-containing protein [Tindallia magadiensis]SFH60173.1 exopolyphosphatase / guanosine-5'-triphosphate,3'-diphosphate pyrophosphatase [Tindallia magadiensis]